MSAGRLKPILFGIAGTLLLAVVWGVIGGLLHVGPVISFLVGLPLGAIGMTGGLYLGGFFDREAL